MYCLRITKLPFAAIMSVIVAAVCGFSLWGQSFSQPLPPTSAEPALTGRVLREMLGFGPGDVLPALSSEAQHEQMVSAMLNFVSNASIDFESLVADLRKAGESLAHAFTWNEEPSAAMQKLRNARDAIAEACQGAVADLAGQVSPVQTPLISRVLRNRHLDSLLRPLDLREEQRTAILEAQFARDRVTMDAKNWQDREKMAAAREAFAQKLEQILTAEQWAKYEAFGQVVQSRLQAMAATESDFVN